MNPEEKTTTPTMSPQKQNSGFGNRLPQGLLHSHRGQWHTNLRSIKDALYSASTSSWTRANRFCADHHHWMLMLSGLWQVVTCSYSPTCMLQ